MALVFIKCARALDVDGGQYDLAVVAGGTFCKFAGFNYSGDADLLWADVGVVARCAKGVRRMARAWVCDHCNVVIPDNKNVFQYRVSRKDAGQGMFESITRDRTLCTNCMAIELPEVDPNCRPSWFARLMTPRP